MSYQFLGWRFITSQSRWRCAHTQWQSALQGLAAILRLHHCSYPSTQWCFSNDLFLYLAKCFDPDINRKSKSVGMFASFWLLMTLMQGAVMVKRIWLPSVSGSRCRKGLEQSWCGLWLFRRNSPCRGHHAPVLGCLCYWKDWIHW